MKPSRKRIFALLLLCAAVLCAAGCFSVSSQEDTFDFQSFRGIPGITEQEIAAIEALQKEHEYFIYGMLHSTEAFIRNNGEAGGYAALFCEWLTNLFDIPFKLEIFESGELTEKLNNNEVDFSGDVKLTPDHLETYFMTDMIAERQFIIMQLKGSQSLFEISGERPPRYIFAANDSVEAAVAVFVEPGTYEYVWAGDFSEAYRILESGEADAFITTSVAAAFLVDYDKVVIDDFFPLIFEPVSMATANPALEPVISAVNKALQNGAMPHLSYLYNRGYQNFRRHKISTWLTDEEYAYINNRPVVPVAAFNSDYPLSFYNRYDREWQGIFFDLLHEITLLTGLSFKVAHDENEYWSVINSMLINGEAAFVPELVRTKEREEFFIWSETVIQEDQYALISRSDLPNIALNEIMHVKVGLARNTAHAAMFMQWFPNHKNIVEFDGTDQAFYALQNGEVDMVMTTQRRLMHFTHFQELAGYKLNIVFDHPIETRLGFNKNEVVLRSIIDKAFRLIDIERTAIQWTQRTYDYTRKIAEVRFAFFTFFMVFLAAFLGVLIVILIKKRKTQALYKKQMTTLSAIYKSIPDLIFCKNKNGLYTSCNTGFEKFAGYSEKEIIGKTSFMLEGMLERISYDIAGTDQQVLTNGTTAKSEGWFTYTDGTRRFTETYKTPLIQDGKTVGLLGIIRDITDFKLAMETLERILNGIDSMIYVTEPHTGEILFMNDSMKRHYNIAGDCVGQLCFKVLQKDLDERCSFCPCFQLDKEPDKAIVWEEHSTLTNRIYHNIDRYIDWPNGQKVHIQHSSDMTELVAAKEFAEQSSRYKSAFLATMSHEIRTPMNAILGIAEIHLQKETILPDTEEALSKIYESGEMLLNIINDILDLSKIEAGKLELVIVRYDISSLINDTMQLNCLRYEFKPILFTLNIDKDTPLELHGDELRIKQILNNILSNAFKYTDEGKVELFVYAEPARNNQDDTVMIVFRVKDTGQGMTKEQIEKLFDEYTRFNIEANRTTIGTGLGMNITKRLVDMMDGHVTVEGEPGKGVEFTVYLPQKRASSVVCGPDMVDKLENFRYHKAAISKKLSFFREHMPYGSVLVVDDVMSNVYVTKGMLLPYGLNVDSVYSGFEAIEKIKNGNVYDIIFMDHMMPKMDGIEATKIIRDMGYKNFIIALTANALIGRSEMFLQNGFDGFLSKPIDSRELDHFLNEFIKNKKPAEVIQAARQKEQKKEMVKMIDDARTEDLFILDAQNAINMLEKLIAGINDLSDKELNSYIITVHGMKSALANIGEKELSGDALKLEMAGEERNIAFISDKTPAFINALQSLIVKFQPKEENSNAELSGESRSYLREKLLKVKTACLAFEKNTANEILIELKQKAWPHDIKTVLESITLQIFHSAFKKAAAEAENAAGLLNDSGSDKTGV